MIPTIVKSSVPEGYTITFLGNRDNTDYYSASIPDRKVGFPIVVTVSNGTVRHIEDFDAIDIVSSFIKD